MTVKRCFRVLVAVTAFASAIIATTITIAWPFRGFPTTTRVHVDAALQDAAAFPAFSGSLTPAFRVASSFLSRVTP